MFAFVNYPDAGAETKPCCNFVYGEYNEKMNAIIEEVKEKSAPIFEQYGVEYAGVFGSVARGQGTTESDVDLLIRLGTPMGMFVYMRFIRELESVLDKKIDVVTEKSVNKFVRPYILEDLKTIYERK